MASRRGLSPLDTQSSLPSSCWFFPRALSPLTPGSPIGACSRCFPTSAGFTKSGRLATPSMCNEAEPSSRDATARAFASPSLSEQGRPHSLWVRLHDFRPIIMTNSFQLTRTSQALLGAFQMHTDKNRFGGLDRPWPADNAGHNAGLNPADPTGAEPETAAARTKPSGVCGCGARFERSRD